MTTRFRPRALPTWPLAALLVVVRGFLAPWASRDAVSPADAQTSAISRTGTLGGDAWVPLSLEQAYRRRTIAAGTDHLLAQRVVRAPSHCGFDGQTREQAFDDLVAWIERGVRPPGEDVLAADLSRIGLALTPVLHVDDPLAGRR